MTTETFHVTAGDPIVKEHGQNLEEIQEVYIKKKWFYVKWKVQGWKE